MYVYGICNFVTSMPTRLEFGDALRLWILCTLTTDKVLLVQQQQRVATCAGGGFCPMYTSTHTCTTEMNHPLKSLSPYQFLRPDVLMA
jgi:hypothetical protein